MEETSIDKQSSHWTIRFEDKANRKASWVAINRKGVKSVSKTDAMMRPPTQEMIDHALTFVDNFIAWQRRQNANSDNYFSHACPSTGYAKSLNPEWLAYNNLVNEGGDGYNPHPKYV